MTRKTKDSEPDYKSGGFGAGRASLRSDTLRARMQELDAREDQLGRVAEAERRQRAEAQQESNMMASIQLAYDRGELVDMRQALADGGIGRTRGEAIAQASAQMDHEDRRIEAREQAEFRKWRAERAEGTSGDMTAPTAAEAAERDELNARIADHRAQARAQAKTLLLARSLARQDREG